MTGLVGEQNAMLGVASHPPVKRRVAKCM